MIHVDYNDLWSFNLGWLSSRAWDGMQWGGWFRVFGYGVLVRRRAGHDPLFSERSGHRRALAIGNVKIYALTP
ncbi:MAG TPA: hypothetical protein PLC98_24565 [Anaerolineales bacterium]|nr:hypothetical protein [Anaerolineales bacterium]